MSSTDWKIQTSGLPYELAEGLSDAIGNALELEISATALDIADEGRGLWHLDAYCLVGIDPKFAAQRVAGLAADLDMPDAEITIVEVEDLDWVAKSQSDLAPVRAGRFFVHGSHDRALRPFGGVSIEIDAAQAFGTGHHATTQGCLEAFDALLKRARRHTVLDVGCGSGILAIAAALTLRSFVIATDIDPLAVKIAGENAIANGARTWVRTAVAAGTQHKTIRAAAPFDVVFANILARPLQTLAPEIVSVLAPGGRAILSGLTSDQEARVISAYRVQGLHLEHRVAIDGWSTLILV